MVGREGNPHPVGRKRLIGISRLSLFRDPHDGLEREFKSFNRLEGCVSTDWYDKLASEGPILLRHAVQVKNIWIPYGD
jgi:hypothetical protein